MESNRMVHQQGRTITRLAWEAVLPEARQRFLFSVFQQIINELNRGIENLHRQPIGEPELVVSPTNNDLVSFFIRRDSEPQPSYTVTWGSTALSSVQAYSPNGNGGAYFYNATV